VTRPSGEGRIATEVAGWAEPTALGTLIRDALIRRNSQQRDCEDPCKMTYTISASSTRHPVAPLGYSAPWPAATIEVNVREVLLENDLSCSAAAARGRGRWVRGTALACKGRAEVSFYACAAQQSLKHCMEACHALGPVRGERRMTDRESACALRSHARCWLQKSINFNVCEVTSESIEGTIFSSREL
jgi:hypothetical protein